MSVDLNIERKTILKKAICLWAWLLVVIWMGVIFFLSAQPARESSELSRSLISRAMGSAVELTDPSLSPAEKRQLVLELDHTVRNAAHVGVFFILGLLVYNAWHGSGAAGKKALYSSLIICILYALGDEIHQLFVPGRAFQLIDLGLDFLGSFAGISCCLLIWNLIFQFQKGRQKSDMPNNT